MTQGKKRRWISVISIPAASLILGMVVATFLLGPTYKKFDFLYTDFSIDSCVSDFEVSETDFRDNPDDARALHSVCYDKIYSQGLLNEYQVRRVNFQNQHIADNVVMWMVVALTFSGVGLAALQITSSVRIYERNGSDTAIDSTEVSLEKGKIYLKSSVTGLFILLISFAFFYIYVLYVYTITDIGERASPVGNTQARLENFFIEGGVTPRSESVTEELSMPPE